MRVVVGMSGGVDSSLSAALVAEQGHEVVGVTMKLWPCADQDGGATREDACCSPAETIDARAVANRVGVKHYVVDLEARFRSDVVERFVADYAAGRTPNPCVRCNESIKFGALWEHARALGAERVATGHYARVAADGERLLPRVAVDRAKDQTYFLFSLTQEQLAHALFPVGELTKDQVREHARARGLATADKRESQDICFVGRGGVGEFLRAAAPDAFAPGDIVDQHGSVLGAHRGLAGYTIGQRKGLGVAAAEPLYVLRVDRDANRLVLGPRAALMTRRVALTDCTWHLGELPRDGLRCLVRTRYRATPVAATIRAASAFPPQRDGEHPAAAAVFFDEPTLRPAPGQACVAYDQAIDRCLGGGWVI